MKIKRFFILLLALVFLNYLFLGCAHKKARKTASKSFKIKLLSRSFTPKPGIGEKLTQKLKVTKKPKYHAIIQFNESLTLEEHKFLNESGLLLSGSLGANAYVVAIPKGADLSAGKLKKLIRWAGAFNPEDKIKQKLYKKEFYKWAIDEESGKIKLLVQFFRNIDKDTIKADLASIGLKGKLHGAGNSWAILANKEEINKIAELDSVKMIQQGPIPFLPLNDGGRIVANSNQAQQAGYNSPQPVFDKVSGDGVQIGICDSGVDDDHDDFDQVTAAGAAGQSRVYNQRPGSDYHGTHVASIAAGNGFNSEGNVLPAFSLMGHAPQADIGDYPYFNGHVQSYSDAIINDGTDVTNHSYVQSMGVYDDEAESIDLIVRGDAVDTNGNSVPARPQVWAAGNNGTCSQYGDEEGYYAVFSSAKNSISVGSIDTIDKRISDFSSLGPTFDGRIKPDIVAPGCNDSSIKKDNCVPVAPFDVGIMAADNNTQGYLGLYGTSMAAPVVSGTIALMMEQYEITYKVAPDLNPSTYKAILVHTAKDMVKTEEYASREFDNPDTTDAVLYHAGPDYATGFGLIDADAAVDKIAESGQWKEETINSTGSSQTWCIDVLEGTDEIKVVIAWDDEPGSTISAEDTAKLVNDLDVKLIDPDGNTHYPWTLDPLPLTANPGDGALDPIQPGDVDPAYRGADHLNNVEMANVYLPKSGTWKVIVEGFDLPEGNAQPYSLVSSHNFGDWCLSATGFINICDLHPWLCRGRQKDIPDIIIGVEKDFFVIDARRALPVKEICKYVLDCPGCEGGSGWSYCAGWKMDMDFLPEDVIVTVFDQKGVERLVDKTGRAKRTLQIDKQLPGDQFFLLFTDKKGNPYPEKLKVKLELK
jgi:subtilisin family serine protease